MRGERANQVTMGYNHNLFETLSRDKQQDIFEIQSSTQLEIDHQLVSDFLSGEPFQGPAKLIPGRVESIWRYYAQHGVIREQHERYLRDMRDDVSYIISFMYRITEICGHTRYDCKEDFTGEDNHYLTDQQWEDFVDWVDGFYISDYGFPKLNELQCELWASNELVHILITIDRILNVWHGSGPLADRFIHGGTASLNKLAFSTELS